MSASSKRSNGGAPEVPYASRGDKRELALEHWKSLTEMLSGISASDWETETLCAGWTVRDVVGHLLAPNVLSSSQTTAAVIRSGGFNKGLNSLAKRVGSRDVDELLSLMEENSSQVWNSPTLGPAAPLTDIMVHTQDIARPLGLEVAVEPRQVDPALTFVVGSRSDFLFAPRTRYRGLRLLATDLTWKCGKGDVVEGPMLELLMALTGRTQALAALEGPGVATLTGRISKRSTAG